MPHSTSDEPEGPLLTLRTDSPEETVRLAVALAECLQPPVTIALIGPLGAGKTCLVRALVAALGDEDSIVNSPTFVLVQEYTGRIPVVHIDAYRLEDEDEFFALGADELLTGNGVCVIEWADRVRGALPEDRLEVTLAHAGPASRTLRFEATGPSSRRLIRKFRQSYRS